jgi:heat-inducible transcriptional repressor
MHFIKRMIGMAPRLTPRQQQILWATVNHYIATAEPVGSKVLAMEYELQISPATIRNAMGALEQSGFLYQPHPSAGRIPSDSGYRVYVDQLISPSEQRALQIEQQLLERLTPQHLSLDALLRDVTRILARLSGCVALVTLPQPARVLLRHLQLVLVEANQILLIVVTDHYETQSVLMPLPSTRSGTAQPGEIEGELQLLSNFLNHHLVGKELSDLSDLDWHDLDHEFSLYIADLDRLLQQMASRIQARDATQIVFGGLTEVLRQPEFAALEQAQTLIHLLEQHPDQLWPLFGRVAPEPSQSKGSGEAASLETPPPPKVRIQIGSENPLNPIQTCALISCQYQHRQTGVGSVGVLGPTRMAYEKVIALVEGTAGFLSHC